MRDLMLVQGRAVAQAVSRRLPTAAARVRALSGRVGFVVHKVALGQVFSEYFGFRCHFIPPAAAHTSLSVIRG
jgi:hypothetical protein